VGLADSCATARPLVFVNKNVAKRMATRDIAISALRCE
jgi:hypothetical protein